MRLLPLLHAAGLFLSFPLHAGVLINEIMYHPVELPAFDAAGDPVLDLTEDVHEFIELKNMGSTAVSLAGWRLRGAADYDFPAGASIPAQGFAVVAKFPARVESIPAYFDCVIKYPLMCLDFVAFGNRCRFAFGGVAGRGLAGLRLRWLAAWGGIFPAPRRCLRR